MITYALYLREGKAVKQGPKRSVDQIPRLCAAGYLTLISVLKSGILSHNPPCAVWRTIADIACRNTRSRVACMNDSPAADADGNVVDMSVSCVENQIAGTCLGHADFFADARLFAGDSGQADTKFAEDCLCKSRTVGTMCETGTAINIWASHKLKGIGSNR